MLKPDFSLRPLFVLLTAMEKLVSPTGYPEEMGL